MYFKHFIVLQGFPDFHPPEHFKESLVKAVMDDNPLSNQYTRSFVSIPNWYTSFSRVILTLKNTIASILMSCKQRVFFPVFSSNFYETEDNMLHSQDKVFNAYSR